jgi:hypothetical protein
MRRVVFLGALVTLLAVLATPVSAQTPETWYVNASAGPGFGTGGTSAGSLTGIGLNVLPRLSIQAEFGTSQDSVRNQHLAADFGGAPTTRSAAFLMNGNVRLQLPSAGRWNPSVTAGAGTYRGSWIMPNGSPGRLPSIDRATYPALNVGGALNYRVKDWLGLGANYRHYYVMSQEPATNLRTSARENTRVNSVTFGATLYLK